eukprot:131372_1
MDDVHAKQTIFATVLQVVFLAPAIAAIVIAADYDEKTSACGNPDDYTINLQTFLYLGGGTQIVYGVISMALRCIGTGTERSDGCEGLFLLVLAIIGLVMWDNQFSEECQEEPIAKMILAWSVIPFCAMGLICIIICCYVACAQKGWALIIQNIYSISVFVPCG